jgi:hypothetical protein
LTRRTVPARLLVIGTYRADALPDGHPFLSTLQRLRAGGAYTEIELGALTLERSKRTVRRLARSRSPMASCARRTTRARDMLCVSWRWSTICWSSAG